MRRLPACLLMAVVAASLAGCFESKEDRAVAAYRDRDFATALRLAEELADAGHPRGYELLALAAAQGLGTERSYREAMAWIDKAVAADPAYHGTRDMLRGRIAAAEVAMQDHFAKNEFVRAFELARPLADYGSTVAIELVNRLYTGHYVPLPESEMAWRDFWHDCSGNTRREGAGADDAFFVERCAGRRVVWEGYQVGHGGDTITIRMSPGRPRAREDVVVELVEAPDDAVARPGRKLRFAGTVVGRGDATHPDRLRDGVVLGAGLLSPAEAAAEIREQREKAAQICGRLVESQVRARYEAQSGAPEEEGKRRSASRLYYLLAVTSPPTALERRADGGWHGTIEGFVRVTNIHADSTATVDFTAHCAVHADHESIAGLVDKAEVSAVELSEPQQAGLLE